MELVYLWVEDYKNIQKQGFNFSPRFECKYDDVKNELTIDENDDYIENFFGENINVTAIVGKNGSGKSSLFHSLIEANDVFFSSVPSVEHKFIMCYLEDGEKVLERNIIFNNKTDFILKKKISDTMRNRPSHPFNLLHYDSSSTYFQRYWNNKGSMTTMGGANFTPYKDILLHYEYINLIPNKDILLNELNEEERKYIIYHIFDKKDKIINTFFEPSAIHINSFDGTMCDSCTNFEDFEIYNLKKYLNRIMDEIFKKIDVEDMKKIASSKKEFYHRKYSLIDIKNDISESNNLSSLSKIISLKINENIYIGEVEPIERKKFKKSMEGLEKYIERSKKIENKDELFSKEDGFFKVNIDVLKEEYLVFFFQIEPHLSIYYIDEEKDLKYNDLSNGEKELLKIRFYIDEFIKNKVKKNNDIIILLDEINNHLHPNWQKRVIKYITDFLNKIDKKFHLIITSHSPFLLSDIPKQNIIFLDKDEKGNCKVVDGLNEKKQTFGANIHTLLSDSFFMEDGLMGEFAKGKIQEIMDFLNGKKAIEEISTKEEHIKQVIETIGEPFLKEKLSKMYDKKYPKTNEEKIAELQKQIDELR